MRQCVTSGFLVVAITNDDTSGADSACGACRVNGYRQVLKNSSFRSEAFCLLLIPYPTYILSGRCERYLEGHHKSKFSHRSSDTH